MPLGVGMVNSDAVVSELHQTASTRLQTPSSMSSAIQSAAQPGYSSAAGHLCCVIVEDQTMFLQLLTGMLRTLPGIDISATAMTVVAAVQACRALPVDLLILDLTLPDGSGLDVFRVAVDSRPNVECVVLSSAASEFECPQPLRHNLRAVIDKTHAYSRLQEIIADVVHRRSQTGGSIPPEALNPAKVLRPREIEVFRLIGFGLKTAEISERLGISPHTVETHRRNIAGKLGATRGGLVRLATIHNQTSLQPPGER